MKSLKRAYFISFIVVVFVIAILYYVNSLDNTAEVFDGILVKLSDWNFSV